jgi:hypothetical protein
MAKSSSLVHRLARVGLLLAVFAGGYLTGSLGQQRADAQLGQMGTDAAKQAAQGSGLGGAMELGTAIVDMQGHVDGLQKNIEALKKVKAALGG